MASDIASKYEFVVSTLRDEIVHGVYGPGNRLPNRSEMVTRFGAGMATVQKALDDLVQDGFLYAQTRKGTFVMDRPPHLYCYGLVVPTAAEWSRHYTAVRMALRSIASDRAFQVREYHSSREVGLREDVLQLCADVSKHRLAGLIFAGVMSRSDLEGTPIVEKPDMPRVAIQHVAEMGVPSIFGDLDAFVGRAVEFLRSKGRKRIAHLCIDYGTDRHFKRLEGLIRQCGVEVKPYWIQGVTLGSVFHAARNIVHLLMRLQGDDRPDALIIHDDNLIEHAIAGLLAAGVKVPDELLVVAQANFPATVPSVLPLVHLGFDLNQIIRESLRLLDIQRRGQTPPSNTRIPPVFEDEIIARSGG
jgi:DNA-binding LacI/PurR family transcriptional regulator